MVRKLVDSEFPHYANLSLSRLGESGSSNVLFRLGNKLLVRLPRQPGGGVAICSEHEWMPKIGCHLPVAVPDVIALGKPAFGFEEHWSILSWLEGERPISYVPNEACQDDRLLLAADLADMILALRSVDSSGVLSLRGLRHYRGDSLKAFDKQTRKNIQHCRSIRGLDLDFDAALDVWEDALDLPGASEVGSDRWYHADLVAENLLLKDGRLTGVLDFGGLGIGDPTIDLHGAWELFDPLAREVFRERLGVDDAEWLRGRAWALAISFGAFSYYWTKMPGRIRDRTAMARSVLLDATSCS